MSEQNNLANTTASPVVGQKLNNNAQFNWVKTLALVLTLGFALLVVFVLPDYISTPDSASIPVELSQTDNKPVLAESPWQDAQIAKQRRAAQDLLSKMLNLQQTLEAKRVDMWAKDEFEKAMAQAAEADLFYRQQDFTQSTELYQQSLATFEQLVARAEPVFKQAMTEGQQAIAAGEASQALAAFELAVAINPEDKNAQQGLASASVLEQIVSLAKRVDRALVDGELASAEQFASQAIQLDKTSATAKQKLAQVKAAQTEDRFKQAMSVGLTAMQAERFVDAQAHFEKALAIKANNEQATINLAAAKSKQLSVEISHLITQANQHVANEEWAAANTTFSQANNLDSTVVEAKIGVIKTRARASLDHQLTDTLKRPERLTSPAVRQEAGQFLQQAKQIPNPGPKLQQQIAQLQHLLTSASQPISLVLKSDNLTEIRIKHIGDMGRFTEKTIALVPGTYTAIGSRQGYRDVIHSFALTAGSNAPTLEIMCQDKVIN